MPSKGTSRKASKSRTSKEPPKQDAPPESGSSAAEPTPPGTDDAVHAKAQQHAARVELFRKGAIPVLMANALGLDTLADTPVYYTYLEQLRTDAGNPKDPIQQMLIEQMAIAHFRIAQMHARAQAAEHHEGLKVCNTAATRLMGEFRRSALALRILQGASDAERTSQSKPKAKIIKMAR